MSLTMLSRPNVSEWMDGWGRGERRARPTYAILYGMLMTCEACLVCCIHNANACQAIGVVGQAADLVRCGRLRGHARSRACVHVRAQARHAISVFAPERRPDFGGPKLWQAAYHPHTADRATRAVRRTFGIARHHGRASVQAMGAACTRPSRTPNALKRWR